MEELGRTAVPSGHEQPRLVELVAALSLATDLGLGQPMEHGLRSCLIATSLAGTLDLDEDERTSIYWVTLLAMVGCTGDSSEMSEIFGDDIEFRRGMYGVGSGETDLPSYLFSRASSPTLEPTDMDVVMKAFVADCQIAGRFAERLGLGEEVSRPLQQKFARWDGMGIPPGMAGEEIPLAARVLGLTWRAEAEHRIRGTEAAIDLLERHAGATLDPNLVAAFGSALPEIVEELGENPWDEVIARAPAGARLMGEAYESALEALGDFADLKSRWFGGHSRAVAELSEAAAWRLGLKDPEVSHIRHAAFVHSLGRTGVPNTIWDKEGPLSVSERERMQLYPYMTDRILRHGSLTQLADMASQSQERLDGSGYPRGLAGAAIPAGSRLLAAADVYQSLCEARPHRGPVLPEAAARHLRDEVQEGRLDGEAVEGVLAAAGHQPKRHRSAPAGLTAREVEVLRLIALGNTSADTAGELGIQTKTVSTHIEHIYAKIGASNRSTATVFAMEHGLL
jgi:HD-GYP domain-containing protein (c-di-GMP phosphodiesterase class II)